MTILIWLALGAAIGAGASWVLSLDTTFRRILNVLIGMAGALAGLIPPALRSPGSQGRNKALALRV